MAEDLYHPNGKPVSEENPLPVSGLGGGGSVEWDDIEGKPNTFPPASHNHDGEYQPVGNYAPADHNHDGEYAPTSHTHTVADVSGLQAELDAINARLDALEGGDGDA